jgi:DGQHR domain-containing protein
LNGEKDMSDCSLIPDQESNEAFLYPLLSEKKITQQKRQRSNQYIFKTVHKADLEEHLSQNWEVSKEYKKTARIKKKKSHDVLLEDRVWCLFERMGYKELNGEKFNITFTRDDDGKGRKQIDVFACDNETALVIECKSKETRGRRTLQKDLHETICLKNYIRKSIFAHCKEKPPPKIIWIYATHNIIWSEPDVERASSEKIVIITENELQYFEAFIKHMGPAGKYQILSEFLKNQKIPGIPDVKIPGIKGKIGGEVFYSFVTTPRALLKISFVNHQAFNHPDGRPAYQRMVSSSRIKEIGKFIKEGGYFPTNILINFMDPPKFLPLSNKENTDPNIKFGWIELPKKYRSAWVIDGQHRLYGFSKLEDEYLDQSLFVLGFERMETRREADLFITINHKQKSVPSALLDNLLADIRMGSNDPKIALRALASAVVRSLNADNTSSLFRRFALPGVPPEPHQNLTITEALNGLNRSTLLGKVVHGSIVPGPLSDATDTQTINRARKVLNGYFEELRKASPSRWELGRIAYICVNPGIRAHLALINEIVKYLSYKQDIDFQTLQEKDFIDKITEIARPVFDYIKDSSDEQIEESFSRKFGEGGVKEYLFKMCELVQQKYDDFGSEEFKEYLERRDDDRVSEADHLIINLTGDIANYVISVLKKIHGTHSMPSGDPAFWELGIESRRAKDNAYKKQQEIPPGPKRLPREAYLDILDIKEIIQQSNNWAHFESVFNIPLTGEKKGKKYYTTWLAKFNELRRIPAHKSSLRTYGPEDFDFLDFIRSEFYDRLEQNKT